MVIRSNQCSDVNMSIFKYTINYTLITFKIILKRKNASVYYRSVAFCKNVFNKNREFYPHFASAVFTFCPLRPGSPGSPCNTELNNKANDDANKTVASVPNK